MNLEAAVPSPPAPDRRIRLYPAALAGWIFTALLEALGIMVYTGVFLRKYEVADLVVHVLMWGLTTYLPVVVLLSVWTMAGGTRVAQGLLLLVAGPAAVWWMVPKIIVPWHA